MSNPVPETTEGNPNFQRWCAFLADHINITPVIPAALLAFIWERSPTGEEATPRRIAAGLGCSDEEAQEWWVQTQARGILEPHHFSEVFAAQDVIAARRAEHHAFQLTMRNVGWRLADIAQALLTETDEAQRAVLAAERAALLLRQRDEFAVEGGRLGALEVEDATQLAAALAALTHTRAMHVRRLAMQVVQEVQLHPERLEALLAHPGVLLDTTCSAEDYDLDVCGTPYIRAQLA